MGLLDGLRGAGESGDEPFDPEKIARQIHGEDEPTDVAVPASMPMSSDYERALDRWAREGVLSVPEVDVALCRDVERVVAAARAHGMALDTLGRAEERAEDGMAEHSAVLAAKRRDRLAEVAAGSVETPLSDGNAWADDLAKRLDVHILAIDHALSRVVN